MSTLLDSLWQGMLVATIMTAILKFIPNLNATTRYACWWITLVAIALLPLRAMQSPPNASSAAAETSNDWTPSATPASLVLVHDDSSSIIVAAPPTVAPEVASTTHTNAATQSRFPIRLDAEPVAIVVAVIWASATMTLLVRLAFSFRSLRRLKRNATPAPSDLQNRLSALASKARVQRPVRLLISDEVAGPMLLGLFRPAIAVPPALSAQISETDFDHVALHEMAHLRRYDDWMNLLQKLLQAALPIQPAVFWIDRQLTLERETACDDWAIAFVEKPKHYVASLTRIAELTLWARCGLLCTGAAGDPSQLHRRVQRLLDKTRNVATRVSRKPFAAAAVTLVALSIATLQAPQVFALVDSTDSEIGSNAIESTSATAKSSGVANTERHENKSLSVTDGGRLKFTSFTGGIELKTHDRPTVELDSMLKANDEESTQAIGLIEYDYKVADGNVSIEVRWKNDKRPRNFNLSTCRHTLLVPRKFDIDVTTNAGDVRAEGLHGRVVAKTSGGAIRLSGIEGQVTANTGAGDIHFDASRGNAELVTSGGSITLTHLEGDVSARTSAGDIEASAVSGRLVGRTFGGSIRAEIDAAHEKPVEFITSAGDVRLTVPDNFKCDLTADTSAGEVKCDLPVRGTVNREHVEGDVNGGGRKVTLKTSGGNVEIRTARPAH